MGTIHKETVLEELRERFGDKVADIVELFTKKEGIAKEDQDSILIK